MLRYKRGRTYGLRHGYLTLNDTLSPLACLLLDCCLLMCLALAFLFPLVPDCRFWITLTLACLLGSVSSKKVRLNFLKLQSALANFGAVLVL